MNVVPPNTLYIFRPYTANRGAISTVWFDRRRIARDVAEEKESLELACRRAGCLIDDEVSRGISRSRIVLGWYPVFEIRRALQAIGPLKLLLHHTKRYFSNEPN